MNKNNTYSNLLNGLGPNTIIQQFINKKGSYSSFIRLIHYRNNSLKSSFGLEVVNSVPKDDYFYSLNLRYNPSLSSNVQVYKLSLSSLKGLLQVAEIISEFLLLVNLKRRKVIKLKKLFWISSEELTTFMF